MPHRKTLASLEAICLSLAATSLLIATAPALAGSGTQSARTPRTGPPAAATHGPHARVVQAGAGTVAAETNGNSGPKRKPNGNQTPASPSPALCNSYKNDAVRKSCLQTVVGAPEYSTGTHSGSHIP